MSAVLSDRQLMFLIENRVFKGTSENDSRSSRIIVRPELPSAETSKFRGQRFELNGNIDVRICSHPIDIDIFYGIYDGELALMHLPSKDEKGLSLLSGNNTIVSLLEQHFDTLWNDPDLIPYIEQIIN